MHYQGWAGSVIAINITITKRLAITTIIVNITPASMSLKVYTFEVKDHHIHRP
jgi:hypothetical protein